MLVGGKAVPVPGKCLACCRRSTDDCGWVSPLSSAPVPRARPARGPARDGRGNLRASVAACASGCNRLARERRGCWLGGGALGVLFSQDSRQGFQALAPPPPAPLKAALGRRFHLDFVERARYTRTKPKCPRSLRLRQALPGAPPIEAAPVSSHHTPTGHKGP